MFASTSKVSICNQALMDIAANIIQDFDEDPSKEANECRAAYPVVLDEVLEAHAWGFAKKWAALAEDADYTFVTDDYDTAYEVPSDFIQWVRPETIGTLFERVGNVFLTNLSDGYNAQYIRRVEDPTLYPSHFISAFSSKLKARLAPSLAGKGAKKIEWLTIYETVDLPRAQQQDSRGDNTPIVNQTKHTTGTDPWLVASRRSG